MSNRWQIGKDNQIRAPIMSREEDDLMKNENQNDDFEFDDSADDNLSIPDNPYGSEDLNDDDDDLLGGDGSGDFDLGDGLDGSLEGDDLDDLVDVEDGDQDSEDALGDDHTDSATRTDESYEYEDDEPEAFKLGWKSYVGIGLSAVVVVAGLSMVMFGGGSEPSQPQQAMGPERLEQVAPQANEQNNPPPSNASANNQSGANGGQGAPSTQQPTTSSNPNSGNDDWSAADGNEPVISSPGQEEAPPGTNLGEQEILEFVEEDFVLRNDFKALRGTVNNQGRQVRSLSDAVSDTQDSVSALEKRVAKLEEGGSSKASSDQSEPSTDSSEGGEIKPSAQVREAQIRLKAFNYRPGPIDGLMGRQTSAALERFQKQLDLQVTGNLNEETVKALNEQSEMYAGSYKSRTKQPSRDTTPEAADAWYVRGVTSERAIIYQQDGSSYAVNKGSEVPGFGQVTELDPQEHLVVTTKGTIGLK
jgi:peptidoglycan hydrolase-like protein with peptidoglycan-binding domain